MRVVNSTLGGPLTGLELPLYSPDPNPAELAQLQRTSHLQQLKRETRRS